MKEDKTIQKRRSRSRRIRLTVNNQAYDLEIGNRPDQTNATHTLAHTLRENLGLTGTKVSCGQGACGCCNVIMDGKAVPSCMLLTIECGGKNITTIEGLSDNVTGKIDPLQQAFIDHTAFQCGYCTPGIIISAKVLLSEKTSPSKEEIQEALSGNFCRCISHYQVVEAVMDAASKRDESNG